MASSSIKKLFCIFHVGGECVNNSDGKMMYEGGVISGRLIEKGMTYEEIRRLVAEELWHEDEGFKMKFKVSYAEDVLLDLVDDVGVAQLIDYNDTNGHVYICKIEKEVNEVAQQCSPQEIDHLGARCSARSISPPIWDFDTEFLNIPSPVQSVPALSMGHSGHGATTLGSLAVESLPTPVPVMNASKWKDIFMGVGQTFTDADEFRHALYKYSLADNFPYNYKKNHKHKMIVECKVDGCPWKISAYSVDKNNSFLVVRRCLSEHMHYAQDNLVIPHKKRRTLTSAVIMDELRCSVDKFPNEIRKDLQREYGLTLDYQQAYRAKGRALEKMHGLAKDSYALIPWVCERLKESDKDTVAKWVASTDDRFEALFIAYGCCIKGFLEGARPILYVDGCHLSGPYQGTLLGAQAYDADNELFPVAYAIVGGETHDEWSWFLRNIKEIVGSVELTIVSDRHHAIIGAVRAIFGHERHAYCYRHLKENFSSEFLRIIRAKGKTSGQTKEAALKYLDAIAYARLDSEFINAMGKMMTFNPELVQWLESNGDMERWARSKFPHKRWDNITTNLAESFNAWILTERRHNIVVLMHEHREKLAQKMLNSKLALRNWVNGVGPNIEAKLQENVSKCGRMTVKDHGMSIFKVITKKGDVRVNLVLRECTCKGCQMSGLPCPHACAAIKSIHGNLYAYVEECYLKAAQEKMYARPMIPVETYDMPTPETLKDLDSSYKKLLPPKTSRRPGRPRVRRKESQFQDKKVYHCSRCGEGGHTVKTCANPNPC